MSAAAGVRAEADVLVKALLIMCPSSDNTARWFRRAVREVLPDLPLNDQGGLHREAFKALIDSHVARQAIEAGTEDLRPVNGNLAFHVAGLLHMVAQAEALAENVDTFTARQAQIERMSRAQAAARFALKAREFGDVAEVSDFDLDENDVPCHPGGGIHSEAFDALWEARMWARRTALLKPAQEVQGDD